MRHGFWLKVALIGLVGGVVALIACASGEQVENSPTTPDELKTRILEWAEGAPSKVQLQGEGQDRPLPFRHYGEGGLPVLLQIEAGQPFPGPILYDGSSHYIRPTEDGAGLRAGQWIEVPQQLLQGDAGRRELGDLVDSLTWFWIFDPLTLLRASDPVGELAPVEEGSSLSYKGRVVVENLRTSVPSGLDENALSNADGWEVEVTAGVDGAITEFTLRAKLDTNFSYTVPWERTDTEPQIPDDVVSFERFLEAQ